MKKVLLSSVAALAVFSAAAPVFAQGENPASSNQLIQKKYVSERDIADQAYAYVEAHPEDIAAAVEKEPSVIAARAELAKAEAIVGHTHEKAVAAAKANLDEVLADATNSQRNRAIQYLQETYRNAAKAQGNYWNDPTGVEDNKPNPTRIAEDQANQTGRPAVTEEQAAADQAAAQPEPGKPGATDQAKKADAAAKKAGANAKAGQKALPKTHAAK
ncbi:MULTISPECIES: amylase-binding adhesin AbpA [Streptococcus]|uniref:amylase-binding adhesin AbpA n=1 Tax=Streptococcus TaxID=1301 RepID=UPI0008ADC276|nr:MULTISPECIES: amylase-binding adhesin AbpA [Streptococcus]MBZ2110752.1 amylase-binding protein [Streptococcus infantis]MBZ2112570.1 amylase-binding protein [Streptococcus infantis]OFK85764.1 amylase-binding protein [Streptococcus sp. HMSC056C01]